MKFNKNTKITDKMLKDLLNFRPCDIETVEQANSTIKVLKYFYEYDESDNIIQVLRNRIKQIEENN